MTGHQPICFDISDTSALVNIALYSSLALLHGYFIANRYESDQYQVMRHGGALLYWINNMLAKFVQNFYTVKRRKNGCQEIKKCPFFFQ